MKPIIQQLQVLLQQQQFKHSQLKLIEMMQTINIKNPTVSSNPTTTKSVLSLISEFQFDPLYDIIFHCWFKKHEDFLQF